MFTEKMGFSNKDDAMRRKAVQHLVRDRRRIEWHTVPLNYLLQFCGRNLSHPIPDKVAANNYSYTGNNYKENP
jgi:hypothetical protein